MINMEPIVCPCCGEEGLCYETFKWVCIYCGFEEDE